MAHDEDLRYEVTGFKAVVPKGVEVYLSDRQAAARHYALKPLKGNRFETLREIEFKAGEVIAFTKRPADKRLMGSLRPAPADEGEPEAKRPAPAANKGKKTSAQASASI